MPSGRITALGATPDFHHGPLSLEQVYGAIAFYLGHKDQVDNDMAARDRVEDAFSEEHPAPPDLKEKLARGRGQSQTQRHTD